MNATGGRILDGVRVVDLSTFVTGGFCSLMLANQGADVVKIERPGTGDDIRQSGPPFVDGESPYYWTLNYDKRSVELDLKTDAGREALVDLVAEADVFVQNFRPGVADRLGVDYDTLSAANEGLVYCSISAYGDSGPWSQRPGYDLLVQGVSGIMSVTGEPGPDGRPVKVGLPQTDLITGMWAAFGVVNALLKRERTGEGDRVELGMLDATLPWLTKQAGKVFAGEEPSRMGTKDPVLAPYQTVETEDGHLNVACLNQRQWRRFCEAIDRPELAEDERFATNADRVEHVAELETEIEDALSARSTAEWMDVLVDAGVPAGPIQSVEAALSNEQTDARGVVGEVSGDDGERTIPTIEHPLNFRHAESGFRSPPPRLGEHTREVFAELGYSADRLDELDAAGAFGDPEG
jgi:crotonobetainyl-CoA:carnitine CoA-transferase CaiB-like acyl-CoA transferase